MLSEDIKKDIDKYNQEKKAQYKPTCPRMAKILEQDHEEADSPNNSEPDLENHCLKTSQIEFTRMSVSATDDFTFKFIFLHF